MWHNSVSFLKVNFTFNKSIYYDVQRNPNFIRTKKTLRRLLTWRLFERKNEKVLHSSLPKGRFESRKFLG